MARKMTNQQKLEALRAAHEWLGTYDAMGGTPIGEGGTRDVPEDMLNAFDLLAEMIDDLTKKELEAYAVERLSLQHPTASKPALRTVAKRIVADNLPKPAARSGRAR